MKKRGKIVTVISIILALSVTVTAAAAVYIALQARMRLFSGYVEQTTAKPGDPEIFLKVAGENVGVDGNVSAYNEAIFPILEEVQSHFSGDNVSWQSKDGRAPISAPNFVLSAKNGEVTNVDYKIIVKGNASIVPALRFGVVTKYYNEEFGQKVTNTTYVCAYDLEASSMPLGDGNIVEGEEVEISVVGWVDPYALAEIGEYDNDTSFSVEIVFTAD